jgi:hypothetical protein
MHGTRQQIGQGRLAHVGQANESHGERVLDATETGGTHGAEIIVAGTLFSFRRHFEATLVVKNEREGMEECNERQGILFFRLTVVVIVVDTMVGPQDRTKRPTRVTNE